MISLLGLVDGFLVVFVVVERRERAERERVLTIEMILKTTRARKAARTHHTSSIAVNEKRNEGNGGEVLCC